MRTVLPYTQPAPYHSQWGEDRWIAENLHLPTHGVFVDIGAGDGVRGSNTLYVENLGWRGLCVDADPRNHQRLRQRCCAVDTCAVSATPGLWPFGMYRHKPSWSGLHRTGTDYQEILATCRTLEDLLDQWRIHHIDLLSIDVEGTELDVWTNPASSSSSTTTPTPTDTATPSMNGWGRTPTHSSTSPRRTSSCVARPPPGGIADERPSARHRSSAARRPDHRHLWPDRRRIGMAGTTRLAPMPRPRSG